jgi:hypothetical protein
VGRWRAGVNKRHPVLMIIDGRCRWTHGVHQQCRRCGSEGEVVGTHFILQRSNCQSPQTDHVGDIEVSTLNSYTGGECDENVIEVDLVVVKMLSFQFWY